jgi:2-oxoglutarate ferredoxin oxidoreductase subunit beta
VEKARKLTPSEMEGKFAIGELYRSDAPEFTDIYERFIEEKQKQNKEERHRGVN